MKKYIAPLGFFLLLLSSCKKDADLMVLDQGQGLDTTWYSYYNEGMKAVQLKNELKSDFSTDAITINSGNPHVFNICNNEMSVSFPSNSVVDINGLPYRGMVIVKSKKITDIGSHVSMVKTAKDYDDKLLQTVASFYIAIFDANNRELYIDSTTSITVSFHTDNINFIPNSSNLYFGNETDLLSFSWNQAANTNQNNITISGNDFINVSFNQLGWVGCSKVYNNSLQHTKVAVNLPSNYTNANTIAYLTIHDRNIALQFHPNVGARQFQSISVPAGLNSRIVIISKQGSSYFLGHSDFNTSAISSTGGFQQITVTPTIKSIDEIKSFLDNL